MGSCLSELGLSHYRFVAYWVCQIMRFIAYYWVWRNIYITFSPYIYILLICISSYLLVFLFVSISISLSPLIFYAVLNPYLTLSPCLSLCFNLYLTCSPFFQLCFNFCITFSPFLSLRFDAYLTFSPCFYFKSLSPFSLYLCIPYSSFLLSFCLMSPAMYNVLYVDMPFTVTQQWTI